MRRVARTVIADATIPIFANELQLMAVLHQLYGTVLVTDIVLEEIERGRRTGLPGPDLAQFAWIEVRGPVAELSEVARFGLDPGESSVLSLALSLRPRPVTVLLDDLEARRASAHLGIDHAGILGVLVRAKRAGLIPQVRPHLDQLAALGFWVAARVLQTTLRLAGED